MKEPECAFVVVVLFVSASVVAVFLELFVSVACCCNMSETEKKCFMQVTPTERHADISLKNKWMVLVTLLFISFLACS